MTTDLRHSDDDCQQTFAQIAWRHSRSIVEMLVKIQKARTEEWKPTKFLQPLECLQLIEPTISDTLPDSTSIGMVKPLHVDTTSVFVLPEDTTVPRWLQRILRRKKKKGNEVVIQDVQNEKRFMKRSHLDVLNGQTHYIAVSYTWDPPDGQDNISGRYWIANRAGHEFEQSPIRNDLLDRITGYLRALRLKHFWIDQHCIVQTTTCTMGRCDHDDCNEKREAVHAMDLIFTSSEHPTAFLSQTINSLEELRLLRALLFNKEFISPSQESQDVRQQIIRITPKSRQFRLVKDMLKLLHCLICDPWWTRAWPFQERYVTNSKLRLLWRHPPHLEERKRALFPEESQVPGEISVRASDFITQATKLCHAMIQHMDEKLLVGEKEMIHRIFQAVVHDGPWFGSRPIIPPLVTTVMLKCIAKPWDRVAIIGNCCRYPKRLVSQYLEQKGASISLSILALVLLNGEVLDNRKEQDQQKVLDMTVSQYLASQLCRNGYYASRCGFIDVTLTMKGIRTRGHLWKLGMVIDASEGFTGTTTTAACNLKSYDEWPTEDSKDANEYRCWWRAARCHKVIEILEDSGYKHLAANLRQLSEHPITDYLFCPDRPSRQGQGQGQGQKITPRLGTIEVLDAIGRGKKVRLGRLWHPGVPEKPSCYSALFVWEENSEHDMEIDQQNTFPAASSKQGGILVSDNNSRSPPPAMVFTGTRVTDFDSSSLDHDQHSQDPDENKFHRYLSMEVEIKDMSTEKERVVFSKETDNLPSLKTKRWLSGLHFPEMGMRPSRLVVFPWPNELVAIGGGARARARQRRHGGAASSSSSRSGHGRPSRTRIYDEIASQLYGWDSTGYEGGGT